MPYRPGDSFKVGFLTKSTASQVLSDADATPTAPLRRNGVVDGAVTVTVTHDSAGRYTASGTIPTTYVAGDDVELAAAWSASATLKGDQIILGKLEYTRAQEAQRELRRLHGVAGIVWCVSPTGNDANDGLTLDTPLRTLAPLKTGATIPAAGNDLILCAGGHYPHTNTVLLAFAGGCRIKGVGKGVTFLDFTISGIDAAGIVLQDLTITGSLTPNVYSQPIGLGSSALAVLIRVATNAWSDGVYTSGPLASANLVAYDCDLTSNYDAFNANGIPPTLNADFFNCNFAVVANNANAFDARCFIVGVNVGGRVRFFGGKMTAVATVAGIPAKCVLNSGSAAVELHGVTCYTESATGTAFDLVNQGTGTIVAIGCDVATTSGNGITVLSGPAGSVLGDVRGKVLGGGTTDLLGDGVQASRVTGNVEGNLAGKVIGGGVSAIFGVGVNAALADATDAGKAAILAALTGSGPYAINHSGGVGAGSAAATLDPTGGTTFAAWATDALQYTSNGTAGVQGLTVRVYTKSTFDDVTGTGLVAEATTNAAGRWASPVYLASGDYYVITDASGDGFEASKVTIRVP